MAKFTGLSLHTLQDRLGQPSGKHVHASSTPHRHMFQLFWYCDGPNAPACYASAETADTAMPPGLSPLEQEFFDHASFPKDGWAMTPCPQHRDLFADHPQEPK